MRLIYESVSRFLYGHGRPLVRSNERDDVKAKRFGTAGGAVVTAAATARAASFGNLDLPPQGVMNANMEVSPILVRRIKTSVISSPRRNFRQQLTRRNADGLGVIQ